MANMDPTTQEKAASAWTDEAKVRSTLKPSSLDIANRGCHISYSQFQFLLRIVAQLKGDGRGIKWEKINIPGRTPKSLQNMWTKINKQINEFEAREKGGEGSAAATSGKAARKRGPCK